MLWLETDNCLWGIRNQLIRLHEPVRIASFDLDDTLIYRPIGKYANMKQWKLLDQSIPSKISHFIRNNYLIIIFTNQAGMSNNKNFNKDDWIIKMEKIIQLFSTESKKHYFAVYVAKKYDIYRKPNLGMWQLMKDDLRREFGINDGIKIRISKKSFFCGDAAGRTSIDFFKRKIYPKSKCGDFSDVDRKFALNIGIKFLTPEDFLLKNHPKIPYKLSGANPKEIIKMVSKNYTFEPRKKEMIIIVGPPGAGKTEFVKKYILQHGYVHISQDICKTKKKCIVMTQKAIEHNESVVIDNTNPDISSRMEYTSIAHAKGYKHIRAIIINTDDIIAKHLNNVRHVYSGGKIPKISEIVFRTFKKKFIKPQKFEYFDKIETVNFAFDTNKLKNSKWKKIFMMLSEY
jgi:bifunctional polynucleotide phosphatase/kinase